MAEPGPEYGTQRNSPPGSDYRRESLHPGQIAENLNAIGLLIKQEQTEVELSELPTLNVSEQHTDPQILHIKPECFHELHGPSIGSLHINMQDTLLKCITYKRETDLQSIKDENTKTELDFPQLEKYRKDLGSRGQQALMKPCSVRVERLSLHKNKTFNTISQLKVNKYTAKFTTNPEGNYCLQRGKNFHTALDLKIHQRIDTERPYCCTQCGKRFCMSDSLKSHQKIHMGERSHTCDQCGKGFTRLDHMKVHYRIHTGERPYKCSQCGKGFIRSSLLKSHLRIHTGEKPYSCARCGNSFIQYAHLHSHQKIHTGEKPHSCDRCGKNFTRLEHLKVHYRIHTGEKPYNCSQCGKCFLSSSKLNDHMLIHTGAKPYSCSQCDKSFRLSGSLKLHQRIHIGEKPHSDDQVTPGHDKNPD